MDVNSTATLIIGAGQGIGLEFVRQFLATNRTDVVYATYRCPDCELLKIDDARLRCLPVDVTIEEQIAQAVQVLKTNNLRYVINCVGLLHDGEMQPEKSLRQIDSEQMLRYFQVNSVSAVLWAKHLQPVFKRSDQSIFASISAKVGSIGDNQLGGWYGYRASKTALNMLMKNVSIEYRRTCPQTIVVVLHPGTTATNLSQPFQRNVPPEKLFSVERTVSQLLKVTDQLSIENSGEFFNWDGQKLPW